MSEEHVLEVDHISKVYGKRTVVDQLSFHVNRGELVSLLGRNGAGKTTTFRMLIGLARPSEGRILFQGDVVTAMPISKRSERGMGYLPQERSVFRHLTVEENILAVLETRKDETGGRGRLRCWTNTA